MIITKIEWENFRQFVGKGGMTFSKEGGISIIYGLNGDGKTTLHQLFQWLFYGECNLEGTILPFSLKKDLQETGVKKRVWGHIEFVHEDETYLLDRYVFFTRKGRDGNETLVLKKKSRTGLLEDIRHPISFIKGILPKEFAPYFFFDGERMVKDIADRGKESAKSLRNAIFHMFGLQRYALALIDIGPEKGAKRKTAMGVLLSESGEDHDAEELLDAKSTYEQWSGVVEDNEKQLNSLQDALERTKEDIERLSDRIGSEESLRGLEDRRKSITTDIQEIDEGRDALIKELVAFINETYSRSFAASAGTRAREAAVDGAHAVPEDMPEGISGELVESLLHHAGRRCLCGNRIGLSETRYLKKLRASLPPNDYRYVAHDFREKSIRFFRDCFSTEGKIRSSIERMHRQIRKRDRLVDERSKIDARLAELSQRRDLAEERDRKEQEKERLLEKIGSTKNRLENARNKLDEAERKLSVMNEEDKGNRLNRMARRLLKDVYFEIEERLDRKTNETREKLQERIQSLLDEIITANRKVSLDNEFRLSVNNEFSTERNSEGQTAGISFAFILGVLDILKEMETGEEDFPLVLDGPFSKLDPGATREVCKKLRVCAKQVILFSKDDLSESLGEDDIENVYLIKSDRSTQTEAHVVLSRNSEMVRAFFSPENRRSHGEEVEG